MSLLAASLGLIVPLGLPGAWAGTLEDGTRAYQHVRYAEALTLLHRALRQARHREQQARAFFFLGCTELALEHQARARELFETLLAIMPSFRPDLALTSPKIATFFEQTRRGYPVPGGPPTLFHRPPPPAAGGRIVPLTLQVRNVSPRLRPVLRYRRASSPGYVSVSPGRAGELSTFSIPMPASSRGPLRYYFVLVDSRGVVVAQIGSPTRPYVLDRGRPALARVRSPWYRKWWIWAIAGAVAAGSAAAFVAATRGDPGAQVRVTILRRDGAGNSVPIFSP